MEMADPSPSSSSKDEEASESHVEEDASRSASLKEEDPSYAPSSSLSGATSKKSSPPSSPPSSEEKDNDDDPENNMDSEAADDQTDSSRVGMDIYSSSAASASVQLVSPPSSAMGYIQDSPHPSLNSSKDQVVPNIPTTPRDPGEEDTYVDIMPTDSPLPATEGASSETDAQEVTSRPREAGEEADLQRPSDRAGGSGGSEQLRPRYIRVSVIDKDATDSSSGSGSNIDSSQQSASYGRGKRYSTCIELPPIQKVPKKDDGDKGGGGSSSFRNKDNNGNDQGGTSSAASCK